MLKILRTRLKQGHHTAPLPEPGQMVVAPEFRGLPVIDREKCQDGCARCAEACPTLGLSVEGGRPSIDLGRCLFCPDCADVCPHGAISFTREHRLGSTKRKGLLHDGTPTPPRIDEMGAELKKLFGRSFKLRQVSAGGCNGCEAELIVTTTLTFDLSRFGVQFVASPRHADALLVTGPVSGNMKLALLKSYDALPAPKLVIACGACALSGGIFRGNAEVNDGVEGILPVDLWIPGCPPHPWTITDALLRHMGVLR